MSTEMFSPFYHASLLEELFSFRSPSSTLCKEEEKYVKQLTNMFMENWQSVSVIGEKHISEMIGLLNNQRQQMSKEVYHLTRKQTRSVETQRKILALGVH